MLSNLAIVFFMTSVPVKVWGHGRSRIKAVLHESCSLEKAAKVIQVTQGANKRNEAHSRKRKRQQDLARNWLWREKKFTDNSKVLSLDTTGH